MCIRDRPWCQELPELGREVAVVAGQEHVGVLAFREFTSTALQHLTDGGLEVFDLEGDVGAFNVVLPRLRIIPLAEFDPLRYL